MNYTVLLEYFSISFEVDEKQQLISLETSLRLYWQDTRIKPLPHSLRSMPVINKKIIARAFCKPNICEGHILVEFNLVIVISKLFLQ